MATPFIKYVGGKRQLLPEIKKRMPGSFNKYFEPFIGGGAVYLEFAAGHKSYINDFNSNLINIYNQIQHNLHDLKDKLDVLQNDFNELSDDTSRKAFYYMQRDKYNEMLDRSEHSAASAALMIFLNKAGYNGLYRVNRAGHFNVPFNQKKKINLYVDSNLEEIAAMLKKTKISQGDFEKACSNAKAGDFVFFDSPYFNTFDTYQPGGFSEADHKRLAKLFKKLSNRGVYCMLTNSNTDFIKELYSDYNIDVVKVKRLVNSDAANRTGEEIIITNY